MAPEWLCEQIVGVIDLMGGQAVHAVAGHRQQYQPVCFCGGDPFQLLQFYLDRGVTSFYVADLDAIRFNRLQAPVLHALAAEVDGEILLDPGWSGTETDQACAEIRKLVTSNAGTRVIAATETGKSLLALERLMEQVPPQQALLGLDYRGGQLLVSAADIESDSNAWVEQAEKLGFHGVVILDLSAVGCGAGPVTGPLCSKLKVTHPRLMIYSGGGVRDALDAERMLSQGCDRCLVATALQPKV
ncbi:MAG: HisA/HisF-related TIM barrel protein [Rubripirellula sp.]|nr:HisA/HisF-related TIM barrel protein [Rubripirellula sp.]